MCLCLGGGATRVTGRGVVGCCFPSVGDRVVLRAFRGELLVRECTNGAVESCGSCTDVFLGRIDGCPSLRRVPLSSVRTFVGRGIRGKGVDISCRGKLINTVGGVCRLVLSGGVRLSCLCPGHSFSGLPGFFSGRRMEGVLSGARGLGRGTVLVAVCDYKLHLDRLLGLGVGSVGSSSKVVEVRRDGNGGSQVMSLPSGLLTALERCCRTFGPGRCLFRNRGNNGCDRQDMRLVLGGTLVGTGIRSRNSMRAKQRSCTARLVRSNVSVQVMGRLLNRRGVGAAVVCARVASVSGRGAPDPLSFLWRWSRLFALCEGGRCIPVVLWRKLFF